MKKKETETFLPGLGDYMYRGLIAEIERAIANDTWHPYEDKLEQLRELVARASSLVPDWETHGVAVPYCFWYDLLNPPSWQEPRKLSEDNRLLLDMSRWSDSRHWTVDEAIDAGLIRGVYGTGMLNGVTGRQHLTLNRQTGAALAAAKKRTAALKPLNFNGPQKKKTDASVGLSNT